ncbi:MAG: leucyl aminopeptidase [Candidatus Hydrogenedentota bacterium]
MEIQVHALNEWTVSADTVLIIPAFEGERPPTPLEISAVTAVREEGVFTGKAEETCVLPCAADCRGVLLLGLGGRDECNGETFRRAAGKAADELRRHRADRAVLFIADGFPAPPEAFIEGLVLGQYEFARYKKPADPPSVSVARLDLVAENRDRVDVTACELARHETANANWARDLAHRGSNDLTPTKLVDEATSMAAEVNCGVEVLGQDELEALGMGALLSVARGSEEPAWLVTLTYTHPQAERTVALLGKGITFDSGGISIKPGQAMHQMRYDMCGAAAVLGAMKSICQRKPSINVVCVVPAAENMPDGWATRPGDIVTAYNGTTIEVHNTDAEGRMILADALAYTAEQHKPSAMVDVATLTGAAIVALGHFAAPVMTPDDRLWAQLEAAGDTTGERVWRLPLWKDHSQLIDAPLGDIANIGPKGEAGTIVGGAFLKRFAGDTPWAHIDIAGMAWDVKHLPYWDANYATGYGVRLLTEWVAREAAEGSR